MTLKPKKEPTKSSNNNFKNFYKVLNNLRNDFSDFILALDFLRISFNFL